ncbi:MAG: nitronate monooxygenase [Micropruina sp.]|nr:nitronate monooxygenase [Micropruina sp.]
MPQQAHPVVIQGGMGIAVSSWGLAREVSRAGQLGVVSGTALDGVVARVLQDGDRGGHVRRALAHFPSPALAKRVFDTYYLEGGRPRVPLPSAPHADDQPVPRGDQAFRDRQLRRWLAKEGHTGVVGINFLEKVQTATLSAALGAMLADVDYVLMGAGIPKEIPRMLTEFAAGRPGKLTIDVDNSTKAYHAVLDPAEVLGDDLPPMNRPQFLAIISLHVLGAYLNRDAEIRPDGFVVEGPLAGGHSAPPRGKMILDEEGQPIYSVKDEADLAKMVDIGLPFWMAGAYSTPEKVAAAVAAGAKGVQCGTLFAMASTSGLRPDLRERLLKGLRDDTLKIKNDALASPTGFPFKVAELDDTLSRQDKYLARERICDLGYLRTPAERPDGKVVYKCASEPIHMYVKKGGEEQNTNGRKCLCNALMANIGLSQVRRDGYVEEPAVTLGQDLEGVRLMLAAHAEGWTGLQAVEWLMSEVEPGYTASDKLDVKVPALV